MSSSEVESFSGDVGGQTGSSSGGGRLGGQANEELRL